MMIEDCSSFRNGHFRFRDPFNVEPQYPRYCDSGRGNSPLNRATGRLLTNTTRQGRSREFIIPIQVEGRDFPTVSGHIDLTHDITDDNVNNNGLHIRSRNRRQHQVDSPHSNSGAGKSVGSKVLSFPLSRNTEYPRSYASRDIGQAASSQWSSSHLSDEIIDLCMYEDMCESSDVCISDNYKENSVSSSTFSKSKSNPSTKSESTLTNLPNHSQQEVKEKVISATPSYPVYMYLKSQLVRDGRLVDYIRGDGNCFFRALSKEIYGSEDFYDDVRQAVVDLIEKYSKEFEQFLDSGISILDHIKEMRKSSTWASSAEIYAAATLVQRDVYVLSPDHTGEAYHWMLFKPRFIYTRDTSYHPCFITLCHTHGNHYDRITPKEGKCNCDYEPPVLSGVHAYVDLTN